MDTNDLLVGWVRCPTGRDELVAITIVQHDELMKGALVCPACSKHCGPSFDRTSVGHDVRLMSWRDGRWQAGFMLG